MKECYLDSNVIISFTSVAFPQFSVARRLILSITQKEIIPTISPLCIDEFLYNYQLVFKSLTKKDKEEKSFQALDKILEIPNINIVNPPTAISEQKKIPDLITDFRLAPRDAYHLLTAKSNNLKYFCTFDNDFEKVFRSGYISRFRIKS